MLDSGGARAGGRHRSTAVHHTLICKVVETNKISHAEGQRCNKTNTLITKTLTLSMQGLTPTMIVSPKTFPSLDKAFLA